MHGWNRNRGGLDFTVSRQQLLKGSERAAPEFASGRIGAQQIGVDDADQAERLSRLLELLVDPGVIAPERAYSDYCDINDAVGVQERLLAAVAAGCRLYP